MYTWLKFAYPKNMATIEQCKKAVELLKITPVEFKEITKEDYFE